MRIKFAKMKSKFFQNPPRPSLFPYGGGGVFLFQKGFSKIFILLPHGEKGRMRGMKGVDFSENENEDPAFWKD